MSKNVVDRNRFPYLFNMLPTTKGRPAAHVSALLDYKEVYGLAAAEKVARTLHDTVQARDAAKAAFDAAQTSTALTAEESAKIDALTAPIKDQLAERDALRKRLAEIDAAVEPVTKQVAEIKSVARARVNMQPLREALDAADRALSDLIAATMKGEPSA